MSGSADWSAGDCVGDCIDDECIEQVLSWLSVLEQRFCGAARRWFAAGGTKVVFSGSSVELPYCGCSLGSNANDRGPTG
eukprot:439156-Prymnesium_polylepis.3